MKIKIIPSSFVMFLVFLSSFSTANTLDNTTVKFSGYIKADGIWSSYSDGTLASGSVGRDFYIPSLTPVGGEDEGQQFDSHIRQSRFRFTSDTAIDGGEKVTGVLEFDFQVTPIGDERISNSRSPRIRHAFMKYKNWVVGQTWSTFQDVKTLPETLDFIGATDGTIFIRQPLVRYTNGPLEFALENPETTVTPFGGGGRVVTDDNLLPDVVARYTFTGDWGHLALAGILRQLAYEDQQNGADIDSTETSFGISVTSKIVLGKNDLRVMANYGSGLGRYLGLNTANGAVLDENGDLEAVDSYGFSVAFRQIWNERWRSNFTYALFSADNDEALTGAAVTEETSSFRANLLYSPAKPITLGGEIAIAERTIESGADGDMTRFQFSAKYAF